MADEVETGSSLPDPYGHGFARTENPLERTMEKWQQQEQLRAGFGIHRISFDSLHHCRTKKGRKLLYG